MTTIFSSVLSLIKQLKKIYALCMPGISSGSISHAHGIIKFVKRKFPQTILVFPSVSRSKPLYTLFNFTLLSQRKICSILMTDAEGQEVGAETMVN